MVEKTTPLLSSGATVVASDGTATVILGPAKYGERWTIRNTAVQNFGSLSGTCTVYKNVRSPSTVIETSQFGSEDNSDTVIELGDGEHAIYYWQGMQDGSVSQVIVTGDVRWGRS